MTSELTIGQALFIAGIALLLLIINRQRLKNKKHLKLRNELSRKNREQDQDEG